MTLSGPDAIRDALRLLVFDFDGVIVDSTRIKTEAFTQLYADEGADVAAALRAHHLANQGVSRYDKIRWCEEKLLGRTADPALVEQRAQRFGELVEQAVIAAPSIPGADEALQHFTGRIPVAVVSATPTAELERILEARGSRGLIGEVRGAPETKSDALRALCEHYGVDAACAVMVGDQPTDLRAALDVGTGFVGVTSDSSVFPEGCVVIPDLHALAAAVDAALMRVAP